MILDSHTHAWGYPTPDYPWVNGVAIPDLDRYTVDIAYTSDKLLADMDRAGIDEAVLVGYPINQWSDNSYTVRAISDSDRLYGIVLIDQFGPSPAETLRSYMAEPGVVGFRVAAMCERTQMWRGFDHDADWLLETIEDETFWETAIDTGAIVQLLLHYTQLDQARELLASFPELTCLIDHVARAGPDVAIADGPFAELAELAEFDDVGIKISEVPHLSEEDFPFSDMHDHVNWLIDQFGSDRVVWGSDYPNGSEEFTYRETLEWLHYLDSLSAEDLEWITGRSLTRFIGGKS